MKAAGIPRALRFALLFAALGPGGIVACRRAAPGFDRVTIVGLPAVATDPYLHSHLPTFAALSSFYEGLVALDANAALVPQLATVWENPSDTVWRLHLRTGVVFHDGRPFGAEDVVASLTRARRLPGSEVVDAVKSITNVRALDGETVEITTARPVATLLAQLAYVAIVPRDAPLAPITHPIGTGPYRFVRGRAYGTFEAERFDRYWGPAPLFRTSRYVPVESPAREARWIAGGSADVAVWVPRSFPAAPDARYRVVRGRPVIDLALGLAESSGPFVDRRCRQAVAAAIDRGRLARADPDRLLTPLPTLVPPGVLGFVPAASARGDPDAARRLLAEAGHPDGIDVSGLVYEGDLALARELASELAAAGIRMRLRSLPRHEYFGALSDRQDALFLFNWVPEWGDAAQLLDGFIHSRDGAYGQHNYLFNADPELDRLIERADRTLDPFARNAALEEAVRAVGREASIVPLVVETRLGAVRGDLDFSPRADGIVRPFDLRRR